MGYVFSFPSEGTYSILTLDHRIIQVVTSKTHPRLQSYAAKRKNIISTLRIQVLHLPNPISRGSLQFFGRSFWSLSQLLVS